MDETTLNEELEKLDASFVEEDEEPEDPDAGSEDTDFEFDEDGNIIIPDDEEEKKGDEEAEKTKVAEEEIGEGEKTPDDENATDKSVRSELDKLKLQATKTLEKMGVKIEDGDVLTALIKLAAENEDKTYEQYLKDEEEADKLEAAKKLIDEQDRTAIRNADLQKLHDLYPETRKYADIAQLPHFDEFATKRLMGYPASDAYSSTHKDEIIASAIESAKSTPKATKSHLQSSVPKGAKDDAVFMSKGELTEMRETFPDMTDKEIAALYKRARQK